jgi:hypothetical protein
MCFKDANEGIFDDNVGTRTLMRLEEYTIISSIYSWASNCNEIKTKTLGTNLLAMRNRILFLKA